MPESAAIQQLVELIATKLVDHPDEVSVTHGGGREGEHSDHYELKVQQDDLGQVIGRQGRTARAIRAVVRAAAAKHGRHAQVEIVE